MVDLVNLHTATPHSIPVHLGNEVSEPQNVLNRTKEVFDQMVGQITPYLLNPAILEESEGGNLTLSFRIKGFEETFSYSSSEISETSKLCSAFNEDIAHAMLGRLLKEKGGELALTPSSEIVHNHVAVRMPINGFIEKGVFALKPFIEKALAGLVKKNETVAKFSDGYTLPISLKQKYPAKLNLLYWLDDVLYLRSSDHPDLLSMEDVLRRNYMKGH